ncbi:MAG TPA: stage II sporulation protein P [Syntrophomonadaceae bacterium]|nr:stage II sporulation protein P [Syntrophomonadaceae bacterium]
MIFFVILTVLLVSAYLLNIIVLPKKPLTFEAEKSYYVIQNQYGQILMETGIEIHVADEFIDENDNHYIITTVKDKIASATLKTSSLEIKDDSIATAALFAPEQVLRPGLSTKHVGIYHTHNDESYVLTSGTSAIPGNGDIMKVGEALKDCLSKSSILVIHSLNDHGPHDINAYHRSRRTAVALIKKSPDMLLDLHRDAAPASAYSTSINGIEVAKVMIVVGRTNPKMQTNLEYAKKVKAAADELHPGLMRGIFIGKGDYNQDLYPTALIFEVGTDSISLSMAKKGVRCLGDALIQVLQNS